MAKRKLSESQRQSVRKDLKQVLASGASNAEALKKVGKKYGINPESVRWYLKELAGGKAKAKVTSKRRGRPRSKTRASRKPRSHAGALVLRAQAAARDKARKATALMRIVPDYRKLQRSETDLRVRIEEVHAEERKLTRRLKQTARDRKTLETKLKGLI